MLGNRRLLLLLILLSAVIGTDENPQPEVTNPPAQTPPAQVPQPITPPSDDSAMNDTLDLMSESPMQASWKSLLSSSTKQLGYLDSMAGEAAYIFYTAPHPFVVTAQIDLKDPYYVDLKMMRCHILIGSFMLDAAAGDWKGTDQSVTCELRYKRKEVRKLESNCSFVVNATYLHLTCQNDFAVEMRYHPRTQYPYLSFLLLLPAQLLVTSAKNLLTSDFPLHHISVTAVFLSLNFMFFVGLLELTTGLLAITDGGLRYLVVTGMFTLTSLRFAQAVLLDRLGRPRQDIWCLIFMLIYLNLLANLATEDWFLLLQSLALVPQIIHNVINVSKARFDRNYITCLLIGHFYIFYYKAVPYNVLNNAPNYTLSAVMALLIVLQLIVLYFQSKRSSRFFLPKWMIPGYYNYFQQIKLGPAHGINVGQCSICLLDLSEEVPVDGLSAPPSDCVNSQQNFDAERVITIMNTPCKHRFHKDCLVSWMDRKMQCPICRSSLPALEV